MSTDDFDDFSHLSLEELFRIEVESQAVVIIDGLLELERDPSATHRIEALMRGAHSLKGAARIVNRESAIRLAHAMEDCFIAAQHGKLVLRKRHIDLLLRAVDLLTRSAQSSEAEIEGWQARHRAEIQEIVSALSKPVPGGEPVPDVVDARRDDAVSNAASTPAVSEPSELPPLPPAPDKSAELSNRALRIAPETFSRLLGFSAEMVVASNWMDQFANELLHFRRMQNGLNASLNLLGESLIGTGANEQLQARLDEVRSSASRTHESLARKLEEFAQFGARFAGLSKRLHQEVLDCRMRPFADGVRGFPRMVRDVAHTLGKRLSLEIAGESTPVDRDILERLEAPLGHLLRNAIDHGIESPEERKKSGKPEEGTIRLEARHSSGLLFITVTDDGRGLDPERIRQAVIQRKLAEEEVAVRLSEAELLDFLFLPGFSMKGHVTDISGRGVGLDVVQVTTREIGGSVRVSSRVGQGMSVELRLPLTLSVVRTLLVEIGGEPYAFPLARITNVMKVPKEKVETIEGREYVTLGEQHVGLVSGHQIFGTDASFHGSDELPIVVIGRDTASYGVVVDRLLGEQELVVRPLDPRLGAVKDISAAALLADQSPVLIVDVEGVARSIESLVSRDQLSNVRRSITTTAASIRKRVLVVEDSLTVRELERKLLDNRGYEVDVAVDGMEGWNAVRTGAYDLVITDVDMPRMDGIELTRLIRKDHRLRSLPVMIVSYKDRDEDRRRGLEAGADCYVAKGSFHHEALLEAVADLIGRPAQ